ncbi:LOW QUALITY PROTEIN: hypothetical protein T265_12765, partial [Opisthorchis viverrini]
KIILDYKRNTPPIRLLRVFRQLTTGYAFLRARQAHSPSSHQLYVLLETEVREISEVNTIGNKFGFVKDSFGTQLDPSSAVYPGNRMCGTRPRYLDIAIHATDCAAPGRPMFQSLRYSRYRDTCEFVMYYANGLLLLYWGGFWSEHAHYPSFRQLYVRLETKLHEISEYTLNCKLIWFCERLTGNPAESLICDDF